MKKVMQQAALLWFKQHFRIQWKKYEGKENIIYSKYYLKTEPTSGALSELQPRNPLLSRNFFTVK